MAHLQKYTAAPHVIVNKKVNKAQYHQTFHRHKVPIVIDNGICEWLILLKKITKKLLCLVTLVLVNLLIN